MIVSIALPLRSAAAADGCATNPTLGNISGSLDTVIVSGRRAAQCGTSERTSAQPRSAEPYYTEQIVCSTDRLQAADGICSATPCGAAFFALRTLHYPDGRAEPAGTRCVSLDQAVATPGVTVAQVFEPCVG